MNRTLLVTTGLFCLAALTSGCNEHEDDDLYKAQACLDGVSESHPEEADDCMAYVEKYTSQQANILKCSILITSGGLMENKITKAYVVLKDSSQSNKAMSFMSVLSLNVPNITKGYEKAVEANGYCEDSGVSGLKYLSNIIVAGTYFAKTMSTLGITGVDSGNAAAVNTAAEALLADCASATPSAACTSDPATVGNAVISISTSYCAAPGANKEVCDQIADTMDQTNGDPTAVGKALFCVLAKKTYNPSTGLCQ
jgi:hypothetical protein